MNAPVSSLLTNAPCHSEWPPWLALNMGELLGEWRVMYVPGSHV